MTPEHLNYLRELVKDGTPDKDGSIYYDAPKEVVDGLGEALDEVERLRKALVKVFNDTGCCPLCDCHDHKRTRDCPLADVG